LYCKIMYFMARKKTMHIKYGVMWLLHLCCRSSTFHIERTHQVSGQIETWKLLMHTIKIKNELEAFNGHKHDNFKNSKNKNFKQTEISNNKANLYVQCHLSLQFATHPHVKDLFFYKSVGGKCLCRTKHKYNI
jgi:hypothetical protein